MLVDSHVHLHPEFDPAEFLDAAAANFARARHDQVLEPSRAGCLILTETDDTDCFGSLAEGRLQTGAWRIQPTAEPISLVAQRPGEAPIVLVAGRQMATAEGLEALALGARTRFPERRPIRVLIDDILRAGALAVIPWGFGKWSGRRGALVGGLIRDLPRGQCFLGDNGGRPALWPRPRLFANAERSGVIVLPGTDPLPLAAEARKAGRYGMLADVVADTVRPFASLQSWLQAQVRSPQTYGPLEHLPTFFHRQIGIRLRKHRGSAN